MGYHSRCLDGGCILLRLNLEMRAVVPQATKYFASRLSSFFFVMPELQTSCQGCVLGDAPLGTSFRAGQAQPRSIEHGRTTGDCSLWTNCKNWMLDPWGSGTDPRPDAWGARIKCASMTCWHIMLTLFLDMTYAAFATLSGSTCWAVHKFCPETQQEPLRLLTA